MAPYQQEEEKARLRRQLSSRAVGLAIQGRWEEAAAVNRDVIDKFPADVEAWNRLGRALAELGDFARAKEAYLKALELAPNNAIAKKNLARLASLSESAATSDGGHGEVLPLRAPARKVSPELFATETSKAEVVNLCNVASGETLARVGPGYQVRLNVKGERLFVETEQGEYLGEVEPKHALRLIKLIEGGNRYTAAILSVGESGVRAVVKEVYQHPSQVGYLSFPVKTAERVRSRIKGSLPRSKIITEEGELIGEVGYLEEEDEYSKSTGESLPEGFSVVGENEAKGELEA